MIVLTDSGFPYRCENDATHGGYCSEHRHLTNYSKKADIQLLNIDCMEYMAGLPDKAFELAIVDPPYGIGADVRQNKSAECGRESNGGRWKSYKISSWDEGIPTDNYFTELSRVSRRQIIWGANYFNLRHPGVVVWDKGENGTLPQGEVAGASFNTFKIFKMCRADAYINNGSEKIHPTQKPVKLYEWLLKNYAKPGDRILDTHLGSGSSAIACHYAGHDFVGCEIDQDYYKAACERFDRETRQQAMAL